MGIYRICCFYIRPHLNCLDGIVYIMLHLLPCLTTVNIVEYLTERELNNRCGVPSICNSLHIELHLTCSIVCCTLPCYAYLNRTCIILGCASCHVYVMVVYHDVSFFPVALLLDSSGYVAIVRIRSTTSVCLLHGPVLLPCGISCKMTIPSKSLLSLLASCSLYCYAALPSTCYIMPPILPCQASNPPFLANRCLAKLPLLFSPSYSVVTCR